MDWTGAEWGTASPLHNRSRATVRPLDAAIRPRVPEPGRGYGFFFFASSRRRYVSVVSLPAPSTNTNVYVPSLLAVYRTACVWPRRSYLSVDVPDAASWVKAVIFAPRRGSPAGRT